MKGASEIKPPQVDSYATDPAGLSFTIQGGFHEPLKMLMLVKDVWFTSRAVEITMLVLSYKC